MAKAPKLSKAEKAAAAAEAAKKAATTYNDQGLNAAQAAQIAKLQKIANQPTLSGYMGGGANQAAIDRAKAEIAKIEAQGKTVLDKQQQEKNAPLVKEAKGKLDAVRAQEARAAQQAQAARMAQVQNRQQQVGQEMAQRQDPRNSYANPYLALTQNMPTPVGYQQGPTSQQAQTTMIGAGGNQPQQMSPAQMAQMQGFAAMQQQQQQQSPYGPPGMPQQQGMPLGMPPQGIAQGIAQGMPQGQYPQGLPPQVLAMQRFRAEEAMMGRPPQQQADTFQPQGPQPQGGNPAQLIAMLQARAQQAPQGQPVRQDMSTFNAAQGGIMMGYK